MAWQVQLEFSGAAMSHDCAHAQSGACPWQLPTMGCIHARSIPSATMPLLASMAGLSCAH